jgi:hypothetical protein
MGVEQHPVAPKQVGSDNESEAEFRCHATESGIPSISWIAGWRLNPN